jgi:hypothetical protein
MEEVGEDVGGVGEKAKPQNERYRQQPAVFYLLMVEDQQGADTVRDEREKDVPDQKKEGDLRSVSHSENNQCNTEHRGEEEDNKQV